ncbi:MAG: PepSY domain-containing protein [Methyloceanibacter sp.]
MTRAALAAAMTAMLMAAAIPARAECLPWKAAGQIIAKNSLLPGNVIYKMVQSKTSGKIIQATLCRNGPRFIYKVTVLGAKGEVTNLTVDARSGQF